MEYLNEKPDVMMDELHALRRVIQAECDEKGKGDAIAWYHEQALNEAEKNGYLLTCVPQNKDMLKLSKIEK
jgi:hypothetical protein